MDKIIVSAASVKIALGFGIFNIALSVIGHIANKIFNNTTSNTFVKRMRTLWIIMLTFAAGMFFYKILAYILIAVLSFMCVGEFWQLMSLKGVNSLFKICGTIIISLLLSFLGLIFTLNGVDNLAIVLFLLIITLMNDFMQAIFGFLIGKHKITPKISPNKTIEGLMGGIFGTVALSIFIGSYAMPDLSILQLSVLGILLAVTGFLGDITVSAIKRYANVKDSSNLLPGHGGFLDRFDSLLYTAPALYFYVLLLQKMYN